MRRNTACMCERARPYRTGAVTVNRMEWSSSTYQGRIGVQNFFYPTSLKDQLLQPCHEDERACLFLLEQLSFLFLVADSYFKFHFSDDHEMILTTTKKIPSYGNTYSIHYVLVKSFLSIVRQLFVATTAWIVH